MERLWGDAHAREVHSALVRKADVLFAGEDDFRARDWALTFPTYRQMPQHLEGRPSCAAFRRGTLTLRVIAMTERVAATSCSHLWGATALIDDVFCAAEARAVDVLDRIGGGDSFASGLLYGLLTGLDGDWSLRCGVAHGALAMSTPDDSSMATLAEVERLMASDVLVTHR